MVRRGALPTLRALQRHTPSSKCVKKPSAQRLTVRVPSGTIKLANLLIESGPALVAPRTWFCGHLLCSAGINLSSQAKQNSCISATLIFPFLTIYGNCRAAELFFSSHLLHCSLRVSRAFVPPLPSHSGWEYHRAHRSCHFLATSAICVTSINICLHETRASNHH